MDDKEKKEEDKPRLIDVLDQLVVPGTVLSYQEEEISFQDTPNAIVKNLKVNICSTETLDEYALHNIHKQIRAKV